MFVLRFSFPKTGGLYLDFFFVSALGPALRWACLVSAGSGHALVGGLPDLRPRRASEMS